MRTFNIISEKLATIALTCVVWLFVFISAAYILREPINAYLDAFCSIGYLCVAGFLEWAKYKITHQKYDDITQG